jgi:hypothetical protein
VVTLRVARELPVLTHWAQRDPRWIEQAMRAEIPPGRLVYGWKAQYFYPSIAIGADYRATVDSPSQHSRPAGTANSNDGGMSRSHLPRVTHRGGCWTTAAAPHATLQRVSEYTGQAERTGRFESAVEKVPGGRSGPDVEGFTIYRLQLDSRYCADVQARARNETR